jgi:hypothetical protein
LRFSSSARLLTRTFRLCRLLLLPLLPHWARAACVAFRLFRTRRQFRFARTGSIAQRRQRIHRRRPALLQIRSRPAAPSTGLIQAARRRRMEVGRAHIVKRHAAFQQLVDHHRHRIHIQPGRRLALMRARFRRAIACGAGVRRLQTKAAAGAAHARGDAEVQQLDLAAPGQEHIARLDVAVYQLVLVPRILQRLATGDSSLITASSASVPCSAR